MITREILHIESNKVFAIDSQDTDENEFQKLTEEEIVKKGFSFVRDYEQIKEVVKKDINNSDIELVIENEIKDEIQKGTFSLSNVYSSIKSFFS